MALTADPRSKRQGSVKIKDFGALHQIEITDIGDFQVSNPKFNITNIFERGTRVGRVRGDDQPITFSFSVNHRDLSDSAVAAMVDVIDFTGYVLTNWTPTNQIAAADADECGKIPEWTVVYTSDGCGGTTTETITMTQAHMTWEFSEGDPNTIKVSGEAWGITRAKS